MPTITAVATGVWSSSLVWDLSRKPQAGDTVVIDTTRSVTLDETGYCLYLDIKGTFIQNSNLVLDDTAGAGILLEDSGNWSNNGTSSAPRQISSASAIPTNPWSLTIEDIDGADTRTIDLAYIEFIGNLWSIGNDGDNITFNGTAYTSPKISNIEPISRPQRIDEHEILGRSSGRVYHVGGNAGVLTVSGSASWDSWLDQRLEAMKNAGLRVSVITRYCHLARGIIERTYYGRSNGLFYQFSVSVREDN